jgi:hypothetical protein
VHSLRSETAADPHPTQSINLASLAAALYPHRAQSNRAVARMLTEPSGQTPPRHADTEKTVDELRARIRKTVAFAESVSEAQHDGAADRKVSWGDKTIGGQDYLLQIAIPNIYFHLTTAYAILRHNGIDIGKRDFLGPIRWVDA